ncbi:hypothetical protein RMN57_05995 [Kitasatospora sp. CM 4170]|uniref:Uncharacterized protein n=1 Tax=Kitasatospora aburaviensis TaxID=67265 RepID=A0ABW1F095_9ACTN|nr:hypothetical protein [Kitasatospora sp. CM 4170]WNM44292.1 hypothetical protein RMN57_05995 [Kitasatospora sp. CM 4170]
MCPASTAATAGLVRPLEFCGAAQEQDPGYAETVTAIVGGSTFDAYSGSPAPRQPIGGVLLPARRTASATDLEFAAASSLRGEQATVVHVAKWTMWLKSSYK